MKEVQHPPDAASLLESMRSIGYTLESALADLIDNSISAKAKTIRVEFRVSPISYVAILDDGIGMSNELLLNAMRHGSTNPLVERQGDDMGRYGLGLKTASLSQCRRLTVLSKCNGIITGFCWDLDIVISKGSWTMLSLDSNDFSTIPHFEDLVALKSGTIVLWQSLDKLSAGEKDVEAAISHQMQYARSHISLVFHRFLNKEDSYPRISIVMNGNKLKGTDPFLCSHKSTQPLEDEIFTVEGKKIFVKPFILPHYSKLSAEEVYDAGGSEGLRSQQGFYVYRNRRLIIWGTWFRLARKDELSKLARVKVDIPNSLDHLWTLDIKKSAAHPPEIVRVNLKRTVDRIREVSGRTITFRGRKVDNIGIVPAWNEVIDRGGVRFDINREHPLIKTYIEGLSRENLCFFKVILSTIEASFPADALYSRMASDIRPEFQNADIAAHLEELAKEMFISLPATSSPRRMLLATLHMLEPFNMYPELTKQIIKEYSR